MSSNKSFVSDCDNDFSDWIELFNPTEEYQNIGNLYISDDIYELQKYQLPDIQINPQSFLCIFASGKNKVNNNEIHTNFKLSSNGESIIISNNSGLIISSIDFPSLGDNISYGRRSDTSEFYVCFTEPSFNLSNNGSAIQETGHSISFSTTNRIQSSPFNLEIYCNKDNSRIYYTTDNSIPDTNSILYTGTPIKLHDKTYSPNIYSNFQTITTKLDSITYNIPKCNIIRATCYQNNSQIGKINSQSFFVGNHFTPMTNLPIISLITAEENLFSNEKGILVPGNIQEENHILNYEQKGQEWERPICFEYINNSGECIINQNIGIRIHGGTSRKANNKSFRLYARNKYDKKYLEYPFFNNEKTKYKRLLLRVSGQDRSLTYFRDALMHTILSETSLNMQAYQPCILYINGEYWGITNLRERQDEYYIETNFNYPADFVQIDSGDELKALTDYVQNNDIRVDIHYNYICSKIDIDNFIDLCIADNYFFRWDYLNRKLWRLNEDDNWKWFMYDMDVGMGGYATGDIPWEFNFFEYMLAPENIDDYTLSSYPTRGNILFKELFKNENFRNKFLNQYILYLKTIFRSQIIISTIDSIKSNIEPEMPNHIKRWGSPSSLEIWNDEVEKLKTYSVFRPCYVYQQINRNYNLTDIDLENTLDCEYLNDSMYNYLIYPNPTSETLKIIYQSFSQKSLHIDIYNSLGTKIHQGNYTSYFGENIIRINTSNFSSGVYILRLYGNITGENIIIIQ